MLNKIAFCGGGTAGHIMPGLAIIEKLKQNLDLEIFWIGSRSKMEKKLVSQASIKFYGIASGKLRRYFSLKNFFDFFKILAGLGEAFFLLLKHKPILLFSKGGYVSVPPVLAARLLRIPIVTHESDFDPGLATRINANFATKIFTSYQETANYFSKALRPKIVWTGNPVRQIIFEGSPQQGKELCGCPPNRPLLLVMGGSLGAKKINQLIFSIKDKLKNKAFIVHQTGNADQQNFNDDENYFARPFFTNELPNLLAAATLVICRAGANTLWELAALAKPSILIPLPATASRGDQLRNARVFADKKAALFILEEDCKPEKLLATIFEVLDNKEKLIEMSRAAQALALKDSSQRIIDELLPFLSRKYKRF